MTDTGIGPRRMPGRPPWLALLAFAAGLLLAGCAGSPLGGSGGTGGDAGAPGAPPTPSPGPPPRACTEIGCESTLTFESDELAAHLAGARPLTVTACLDGDCSTHRVAAGRCAGTGRLLDAGLECNQGKLIVHLGGTAGGKPLGTGTHGARLELAAGGDVLLDERAEAIRFTRNQPNGPDCPPVCWTAVVRLS
jgi:hypothetical protein